MKLKFNLNWLAVLVWMIVIFLLSAQPAGTSNALSGGVTEMIAAIVGRILPSTWFEAVELNHVIRKTAHFVAYMTLGILVMKALFADGHTTQPANITKALLICVGYAVSDEIHQLFVPGRGGRAADVLLDSAGAAVGIAVFLIVWQHHGRKRERKGKEEAALAD